MAVLLVLLLAAGGALAAWLLLRASLPPLDGAQVAAGLSAPVDIERDAQGVPTVTARSRDDLAWGLGFVHGQDRYFQLDLARRLASGELAALIGAAALPSDRRARIFRFRAVAQQVLAEASPAERAWVTAYTRGVNAGLASLGARPFEYFVLRSAPAPWRKEDSILVLHSMWYQLQYGDLARDRQRLAIRSRLDALALEASAAEADASRGEAVFRFLFPRSTEWDAPNVATDAEARLLAEAAPDSEPVPSRDALDIRSLSAASRPAGADVGATAGPPRRDVLAGSNAWAVAGRLTADGAALVANDMHLGLGVPTVWYRARLRLVGGERPLELNGVTMPGTPMLVAGSNGQVAWGVTNSYGNWTSMTAVSCDLTRNRYRTPLGEREFTLVRETLAVRGGEPETLEVRSSALGTVFEVDADARTCLLARWLATEPGASNLRMRELETVADVPAAVSLAGELGVPHLNLLVGDRAGRIAWTAAGRLPSAGPWASPVVWAGPQAQPQLLDPESGLVWSGNSRPIDGEMELALGGDETATGAGYELGARARQIRDGLRALASPIVPGDMLRIQLDDRALFLERWRTLLLGTLDEEALRNRPERLELKRWVEGWDARAAVDSVGYRIVRDFRTRTESAVWTMILEALGVPATGRIASRQFEAPLWRLVTEQPEHMLAARYPDWRAFLLERIDATVAALRAECAQIERCTWGERNTVRIGHPLSRALPFLAGFLDMPARQLPGDQDMPRVQDGAFGASQRFAVSPGREAEGYMQLPGGASGHPLSPFYRAGFESWARGEPAAFLPGPPQHKLTVSPAQGSP